MAIQNGYYLAVISWTGPFVKKAGMVPNIHFVIDVCIQKLIGFGLQGGSWLVHNDISSCEDVDLQTLTNRN